MEPVHDYLAGLEAATVGALPIKLNYVLMARAMDHKADHLAFYHPNTAPVPVRLSQYRLKRDMMATPFIFINDPHWARQTLGIDTWVEDVAFADANAEQPFIKALRELTPVFETDGFRVYRV
jgi:hypothetical protein